MRKLRIGTLIAAIAAIVTGACSLDDTVVPQAHPDNGRPILFVGNSLTYVNELPSIRQSRVLA
ncbi:MAG TPA: hypothetical protein VFC35_07860 [Gemmatimonadaceae bacterium]|nr:hypothetical protein [Gemmatimonadaceae bacterium]